MTSSPSPPVTVAPPAAPTPVSIDTVSSPANVSMICPPVNVPVIATVSAVAVGVGVTFACACTWSLEITTVPKAAVPNNAMRHVGKAAAFCGFVPVNVAKSGGETTSCEGI